MEDGFFDLPSSILYFRRIFRSAALATVVMTPQSPALAPFSASNTIKSLGAPGRSCLGAGGGGAECFSLCLRPAVDRVGRSAQLGRLVFSVARRHDASRSVVAASLFRFGAEFRPARRRFGHRASQPGICLARRAAHRIAQGRAWRLAHGLRRDAGVRLQYRRLFQRAGGALGERRRR